MVRRELATLACVALVWVGCSSDEPSTTPADSAPPTQSPADRDFDVAMACHDILYPVYLSFIDTQDNRVLTDAFGLRSPLYQRGIDTYVAVNGVRLNEGLDAARLTLYSTVFELCEEPDVSNEVLSQFPGDVMYRETGAAAQPDTPAITDGVRDQNVTDIESSQPADDIRYVAFQILAALRQGDAVELARWADFDLPDFEVSTVDQATLVCDVGTYQCAVAINDGESITINLDYSDRGWWGTSIHGDTQPQDGPSAVDVRCDYYSDVGKCLESPDVAAQACGQLGTRVYGIGDGWCPEITHIQAALNQHSPGAVDIDGYYGLNTQQAIINFQQVNGLNPDGLTGQDTWTALAEYLEA